MAGIQMRKSVLTLDMLKAEYGFTHDEQKYLRKSGGLESHKVGKHIFYNGSFVDKWITQHDRDGVNWEAK